MNLIQKMKNCNTSIKVALAFAISMLLIAWQMSGHENTNIVIFILIALYMTIEQGGRPKKDCSR